MADLDLIGIIGKCPHGAFASVCPLCECDRLRAQVAALTQRAEAAEAKAERMREALRLAVPWLERLGPRGLKGVDDALAAALAAMGEG